MNKSFLLFILMMLPSSLSSATPPADLVLSYDPQAQTLSAQGHHPTQERSEHFIRRMEVTLNDLEPQKLYFTRQDSLSEFKLKVPLTVKPGDKIHVEVFCSKGGDKAADLMIAEVEKPRKDPVVDLKAIKDQDHKGLQVIP